MEEIQEAASRHVHTHVAATGLTDLTLAIQLGCELPVNKLEMVLFYSDLHLFVPMCVLLNILSSMLSKCH